jgi:peptide/nickel transport system permease protein
MINGRLGQFFRTPGAWFGSLFLGLILLMALIGPLLFHGDPHSFDLTVAQDLQSPNAHFWFGSDDLGRDIFLRCIHAARVSLMVGSAAMLVAVLIGCGIGLLSGYIGGWVDNALMRLVDALMGLPMIMVLLIIQAIFKPGLGSVIVIIGISGWMGIARLVRAETLSLRERPFVLVARARGLSEWRVAIRHILPNAMRPVIVSAFLGIGHAILTESVLSFLGLGIQPPNVSWGGLLNNSLAFIREAPWMTLFPGGLIALTIFSLQLVGDGVRNSLEGDR